MTEQGLILVVAGVAILFLSIYALVLRLRL